MLSTFGKNIVFHIYWVALSNNLVNYINPLYDFFHAMSLNTSLSLVMCLQRMRELDGFDRDYLIGCGSGFASPVTGQAIADLIGLPIKIYENYREAAVFGGMILCCKATGHPIPQWREARTILPKPSEELQAYFEQWLHARTGFQQFSFYP